MRRSISFWGYLLILATILIFSAALLVISCSSGGNSSGPGDVTEDDDNDADECVPCNETEYCMEILGIDYLCHDGCCVNSADDDAADCYPCDSTTYCQQKLGTSFYCVDECCVNPAETCIDCLSTVQCIQEVGTGYFCLDDCCKIPDTDDDTPDDDTPDDDTPDDDTPDDDTTDDDSPNTDDDDTNQYGCGSAEYMSCLQAATDAYHDCETPCDEMALCQSWNCQLACLVTKLEAQYQCAVDYNCDTSDKLEWLCQVECAETCQDCMKPLITCTINRYTPCFQAWDSCQNACEDQ